MSSRKPPPPEGWPGKPGPGVPNYADVAKGKAKAATGRGHGVSNPPSNPDESFTNSNPGPVTGGPRMTDSTGLAYRPNTSTSSGTGNRSGQGTTPGKNQSSGRAKADGPVALRASFDPQASSPFRRTAQMLTNHFEVQNGNVRQLFEYPLTIARLHPAPPANQAAGLRMPLRVRRRLIYLLIQQLTIGAAYAAPAPGTQPPAAPGTQHPATRITQSTVSGTHPTGPSTQSAAPQSRSSSQHPPQAAQQLSPAALQRQSGAKQAPVTNTPTQPTGAPAQGGHVPQPGVLSPIRVASNYNNALFTVQRIPQQHGVGRPHLVNYYEDWENGPNNDPMVFQITMTNENVLDLHHLIEYLRNPTPQTASAVINGPNINTIQGTKDAILRALNAIFTHRPNILTFTDIPRTRAQAVANTGTNKFFTLPAANTADRTAGDTGPWTVDPVIYALPGYFLSAKAVVGGRLLLNMNTTTSAFYRPFLHAQGQGHLATFVTRIPGNPSLRQIQAHIKGLRVRTTYLAASAQHAGNPPATERCHTVTGLPSVLQRPTAGNTSFVITDPQGQAQRVTVLNYFGQRKWCRLEASEQFFRLTSNLGHSTAGVQAHDLVVALGGSLVPAKLLEVLRGSPVKQKTDTVQHAARPPNANQQMISTHGKTLFGMIPVHQNNTSQPVSPDSSP
jgi:Argonaute linker 1 domain